MDCFFLETYRCVKGQGMINMRTHDTGDLIIQFDVEFPSEKSLTDAQLKVIIEFLVFRFLIFDFFCSNSNQFYPNDHILKFPKVNMWKKHI